MHVFVSYKRQDAAFVKELEHRVTQAGFSVWVDHHIKPTENWEMAIDKAIADAFLLILVMTPAARQSEYVTYEWSYALGLGIKVLPIVLESTDLHPKLERVQFLDFTQRYNEPWDVLLDVIREIAISMQQIRIAARQRQAVVDLAKRLKNIQLAGIVDFEDLHQRINENAISLNKSEVILINDCFDDVFEAVGQMNELSIQQRQGSFVFGGHRFFYNGGNWEVSPNGQELEYFGYGVAWTEAKYNLCRESVKVSLTTTNGSTVVTNDVPTRGNAAFGFTLSALNFGNTNADGITLWCDVDFSAIRHRVFAVDPLMQWQSGFYKLHEENSCVFNFSSDYLSMQIKNSSGKGLQPVLNRGITTEDIRTFNVPLIAHMAFFSFYHPEQSAGTTKCRVRSFEIETMVK